MTTQNIPLFQAMRAKMNYLEMHQTVLAQNIANADTPKYQARELSKIDFGTVLKDLVNTKNVRMETTHPGHMPQPNAVEQARNLKQKITYEVSPDKNAIILEEQMVKANQVNMDYNLLTNLIRKQSGMIRTALGRNG